MPADLAAAQPADIALAEFIARRRQLCLPVAPYTAETLSSYLGRLTERNYLNAGMLPAIARRPGRRTVLAQLTGLSERHLASALPELRARSDLSMWPHLTGTVSAVAAIRPACSLCVAARAGTRRKILVFATHDQLLCPTHHRWLGGTELGCKEFTLTGCPDILAANRTHTTLIRRCGRGPARASFTDALLCLSRWAQRRKVRRAPDIRRRRHQLETPDTAIWPHPKVIAAYYPTAVALTKLILSQRKAAAHQGRLTDAIFVEGMAEFHRHVIPDFEPTGAWDPYRRAILEQRPEPDTEVESS